MSNLEAILADAEKRSRKRSWLTIRVYADGYISSDFDYAPRDGEDHRRGGDGIDGNSDRDLEMILEQARIYRENPGKDYGEIKMEALKKHSN